MSALSRLRPQPDNRLAFLHSFIQRPKQVGSIVPSSRFLERRIVRAARAQYARVVVELGPGTGGTTRALLRAMPRDAHLLAIEINPRFADFLRGMGDPRLSVHQGTAAEIGQALEAHALPAPDSILSGIPFSTIERGVGRDILRSVHDVLQPGGVFVAYQVRNRVEQLGREVFGRGRVQTEILNVPPVRVYRWEKSPLRSAGLPLHRA
jgi:phosphatidylethanolamine/phosphatidyl-N-methylethanolamine N-methyltransferase